VTSTTTDTYSVWMILFKSVNAVKIQFHYRNIVSHNEPHLNLVLLTSCLSDLFCFRQKVTKVELPHHIHFTYKICFTKPAVIICFSYIAEKSWSSQFASNSDEFLVQLLKLKQ